MGKRRLTDEYRFSGFRPLATVKGMFGDPKARIVRLVRRGKKLAAALADSGRERSTTARSVGSAISRAATRECTSNSKCGEWTAGGASA